MTVKSYEKPELLVDTRVRVYAKKLDTFWQQYHPHPVSVCEGRSIQLEGAAWEQYIAALRSRSVQGPFPVFNAITVLVRQRTLSVSPTLTTRLVDIAVTDGAAHARVALKTGRRRNSQKMQVGNKALIYERPAVRPRKQRQL